MSKIVLITGATAGIGLSTAHLFAKNNYNLIITGRRKDRLDQLERELKSGYNIEVLSLNFDVRRLNEVEDRLGNLPDEWKDIDILVNNAGLAAGLSLIHKGDVDDWEQMIDTNIKGLLYITRQITPGMVKREKGHIINIGSIAGKEAYEMGNVYNASKFAVDGLTQAMRIDLVDYGIKVTAVNPGASETEFSLVRFKGDQEQADKVYEGFTPLYAEDIAEAVLFAVSRPPHVNIDDLVIMPTSQARSRKIIRKKT